MINPLWLILYGRGVGDAAGGGVGNGVGAGGISLVLNLGSRSSRIARA